MRTIPIQLQEHKNSDATTLCHLIRIETDDGEVIGMTTLDRDVLYHDGRSLLTYKAAVGFQPATIYAAADFGVDNSEFQGLVPEFDLELDEKRVNAGVYDYAKFWLYQVNYENLTMGHMLVMSGTLGETRSVDGITLFGEMRSKLDNFRKPMCELDSLRCRAIFGSTRAEERFPCGYPVETLWKPGQVTSVGLESTRTFTDTSRTEAAGHFEPGVIKWITGDNAGKVIEVEQSTATGIISLAFPLPYPIQVSDEYEIREDCSKQARDATKGCKFWYGAQWIHHFRGEPDIPLGDAGQLATPGAGVGPGSGAAISEDYQQN